MKKDGLLKFNVDSDLDFVKTCIECLPKHVTTVVINVTVEAKSTGGGASTHVTIK
jgi:hypothetical protein